MAFLLNLFKKIKQVSITFCGLDKAGKTTIVNYLITGKFTETTPTTGVNREIMDFPNIQFNIYDLGGQVDFRPMWAEINEKSDGIIYVIDSSDFIRMDETKQLLHQVVNIQTNKILPVLILLHKIDLPDRINRQDFIEQFELSNLEAYWACFETSAKTGEGLLQAFKWFIERFSGGK